MDLITAPLVFRYICRICRIDILPICTLEYHYIAKDSDWSNP